MAGAEEGIEVSQRRSVVVVVGGGRNYAGGICKACRFELEIARCYIR